MTDTTTDTPARGAGEAEYVTVYDQGWTPTEAITVAFGGSPPAGPPMSPARLAAWLRDAAAEAGRPALAPRWYDCSAAAAALELCRFLDAHPWALSADAGPELYRQVSAVDGSRLGEYALTWSQWGWALGAARYLLGLDAAARPELPRLAGSRRVVAGAAG